MRVLVGYLCVFFGGSIGALLRFGAQEAWAKWTPWPGWVVVFLVNVVGSFCIGLAVSSLQGLEKLVHAQSLGQLQAYIRTMDAQDGLSLLAVGFCGAFTTFSTFSLDNVFLYYTKPGQMVLNMALSLVVAFVAVFAGWHVGQILVA